MVARGGGGEVGEIGEMVGKHKLPVINQIGHRDVMNSMATSF